MDSCEEVETGEDAPPLPLPEQGNIQENQNIFGDQTITDIATEITKLPCGWQAEAFYKLPRNQAIAVYQYLNSSVQERLREDFDKQDTFCERVSYLLISVG
ncbi:hypothetical protein NWP22_17425 [Anabaenopsis tanganyikae CS-531]|uniref:Uncharacterized protein n=3 Tax=Anabaenopsis TaxID=110103 RepID=A0ABT6KJG1_9CYAN|nr:MULTISPECIES: hypothetical protein [Anabaenopsis]MDB9539882.1 hypothetical protein [Anabaenopsis arnoldii]MDH6092186.1 hypothetical protein [Anabaenopsis arnoldii]MDH6107615.1 hypothetical protein [Anabaenopsis tanganyikae CS-531]